MAHIHLPDGAFSIFWVAVWFALSAVFTSLLVFKHEKKYAFDIGKLSVASVFTAFAFAVFQIEIPLFGGVHLNLTPLLGIVLGPVLGCSSALVVNILNAALGHGGWSLLGANFLINSTEVLAGYYVFSALSRLTRSKFSAAGISTVVALVSSNFLMVGMIVASGIQGSSLSPIEIGINMLPLMVINVAAAVVEGVVTAFIVHYATALKPDLLSNSEAQRSSK